MQVTSLENIFNVAGEKRPLGGIVAADLHIIHSETTVELR